MNRSCKYFIASVSAKPEVQDVLSLVVDSKDGSVKLDQAIWWADRPRNIGHHLGEVIELPEPVTMAGALGYWRMDDDQHNAVCAQLRAMGR